ncbi:MAG: Hsp70 family protein, partial [Candidatus Obscuribacter sp.]|nr:Hsp70 family protein [Candidatus Obscuribacter sp.]
MSPVLLPVKNKKVFIERTEYKPLIGGPDSGIPPLFEVGSGLHSHAVLGIDIGNESARMATLRSGALIQVGRTTPSVMEEKKPERVTYEGLDCVKEGEIGFARAIKSKIGSDWSFITAGESYSAELLYSLLLESLKDTAQEQLQEVVSKCVLTVPLGFSSAQRALVKRAAEDAGLQVLQLLNEPSAAALQYCCNNYQSSGKFLIVSAGASSLGVMAFEYYRGIIEVKSASGDSRFGADD